MTLTAAFDISPAADLSARCRAFAFAFRQRAPFSLMLPFSALYFQADFPPIFPPLSCRILMIRFAAAATPISRFAFRQVS